MIYRIKNRWFHLNNQKNSPFNWVFISRNYSDWSFIHIWHNQAKINCCNYFYRSNEFTPRTNKSVFIAIQTIKNPAQIKKINIIFNAFSRFANFDTPKLAFEYDELKTLLNEMNYIITVVEMNSNFRKSIFQKYENDSWWSKIFNQIHQNEIFGENAAVFFL